MMPVGNVVRWRWGTDEAGNRVVRALRLYFRVARPAELARV